MRCEALLDALVHADHEDAVARSERPSERGGVAEVGGDDARPLERRRPAGVAHDQRLLVSALGEAGRHQSAHLAARARHDDTHARRVEANPRLAGVRISPATPLSCWPLQLRR
jgi:hypothetical protein